MGSHESTRTRLLDTGVKVLHEQGVRAGVSHIKLAEVASQAGYTTGAAYKHWLCQADFHRDLALAALQWRDRSAVADTINSIRHLVDSEAPLLEVLRVGAEANIHRLPEETEFFTTLALRACAVHDEWLRTASFERVEAGLAAHADLYSALLKVFRRRMRSPFTLGHMVKVIAAMAEGFAIQDGFGARHQHIDRDELGDGVGRDWTLFGTALQFLVEAFTEPDADAVGDEQPQREIRRDDR
jgi:AcrR family transcriptional regulator